MMHGQKMVKILIVYLCISSVKWAEALQLSENNCLAFHPNPEYTEAAVAS